MITITNAKIAGLVPQWAPFRGFSVLFDSPGQSMRPGADGPTLACDVDGDPALGFYRRLRDALASLDLRLLTNSYLFCPLPSSSYHVTLWDGANDGMLGEVASAQRGPIERLVADVPAALRQPHELIGAVRASPLVARRDWDIAFRLGGLSMPLQSVLVAELAPATTGDAARLQELVGARAALSAQIQAAYGFSPYYRYWPHVSLGYFANREHAQLAAPCLAHWRAAFAERLADQTLTLAHADVYGFSDMATFFKAG